MLERWRVWVEGVVADVATCAECHARAREH